MKSRITRRELLQGVAIGSLGMVLAACQPKVVEKIVEKEVTKVVKEVVKETVVVEGESKEVTKVVEKVVTSTPAPREPVKLRVTPGLNPGQGGVDYWKSVGVLYQETYPDRELEMNFQPSWDTLWSAVRGDIAAGEPPDAWMMQENGPGIFWEQGATLALEELANGDSRMGTTVKWCKAVTPQITDEYTYNQHLVGVPIYTTPLMWFYNKPAFEKAGVASYPKTVDEFVEQGRAFKEAGWEYPFWQTGPYGWGGHWMIWSFGAPGVTDATGAKQVIDTPEFLASCEWYWNLVHVDEIINPAYLKQSPQAMVEAQAEKIVLWQEGSYNTVRYMENRALLDVLGVAPRAAGPGGAIQTIGGSALLVSAKTKFPMEAWDFCMVANDPENLANNWLIACLDTCSNCEAFNQPQVREQAPLVFDMANVMESDGRVVWTVPWYWDVGTIAQSMVLKMLEMDSWAAAKALVPEYALQAQAAADEGVKKYGLKE